MFLIIFTLFSAYLIYFYIKEFRYRRRSPPGPIPIPVLGSMVSVARVSSNPTKALAAFADKYGEIFRLKLGSDNYVIPTSIESIHALFSHDDAGGRIVAGVLIDRNLGKNLGIALSNGPIQVKTRNWGMRNLKEYGFGKSSSMEVSILEEVEYLEKYIDRLIESESGLIPINSTFVMATFNIVWQLIVGHRAPDNDLVIKDLVMKGKVMANSGMWGAGPINFFPFLRHLFPQLLGYTVFKDFYDTCHATSKELLKSTLETVREPDFKSPTNFIEAFCVNMEKEKGDPTSIFTEENFQVIFVDILQGSSDTTSSFLESLILYSILFPDVQEKVFQEIEASIPKHDNLQLSDKTKLNYTQAFFYETHRHGLIGANLVPRVATKDIQYKNFNLPKGTIILPDMATAYKDPAVWPNPSTFLPERFLNENGELINQNKILNFGVGKRACPGETVAFANYFIIFVSLLRKYKMSKVPREVSPIQEPAIGMTSKPYPFQAIFAHRS